MSDISCLLQQQQVGLHGSLLAKLSHVTTAQVTDQLKPHGTNQVCSQAATLLVVGFSYNQDLDTNIHTQRWVSVLSNELF